MQKNFKSAPPSPSELLLPPKSWTNVIRTRTPPVSNSNRNSNRRSNSNSNSNSNNFSDFLMALNSRARNSNNKSPLTPKSPKPNSPKPLRQEYLREFTPKEFKRFRNNLRRLTIKNANVKNALAATPSDILIVNNFSKRKGFFSNGLTFSGANLKKLQLTKPKAFQWHTNQHGNIVACVPSGSETISTECLVKNSYGKLKKVKYSLKYPQALVFDSSKTHRGPSNRNTGVSLHKLQNRSIYNALKRGEMQVNNIRSLRNLLN